MHRLRKALGPPNRVHVTGGRYAFDHTIPHTFDVADFEEKTRRARQCAESDSETAATLLEQAAELYCGDFLEDFAGGEWIFTRQQELRERYVQSQLLLGRLLTEQGENSQAARAYRRAIARDPYSAEAHAGLIRAYSRLGERGRALRHYLRLELDPGEVDVNVHPAKSAVRLRGGHSTYPLVVGTIRAALAPEREGGSGTQEDLGVAELLPIGQFASRCK